MVGMTFQINTVMQSADNDGFCRSGAAAQQPEGFFRMIKNRQALLPQCFKAAVDSRALHAALSQPLLGKAGALTATPTHDVNIVVIGADSLPSGYTLFAQVTGYKFMP